VVEKAMTAGSFTALKNFAGEILNSSITGKRTSR
jgi:hypothetical protein